MKNKLADVENLDIAEEQKILVLERFKTLNPDAKILLGGGKEVSVKELVMHIKKGNLFGQQVVKAQISMLKVLTSGAS